MPFSSTAATLSGCSSQASAPTLVDMAYVFLADRCSALWQWHNRCLQRAVLSLCQEVERPVLECMLRATCDNDAPSGGFTSWAARLNMHSVQECLRRRAMSIIVLGSESCAAFAGGKITGSWKLGDPAPDAMGCLLWAIKEQHVFAVQGDWSDVVAHVNSEPACLAPWEVCGVGDRPGRKGRRGRGVVVGAANLVAVNQRRAQERLEETLFAMQTTGGASIAPATESAFGAAAVVGSQAGLEQASRRGVTTRSSAARAAVLASESAAALVCSPQGVACATRSGTKPVIVGGRGAQSLVEPQGPPRASFAAAPCRLGQEDDDFEPGMEVEPDDIMELGDLSGPPVLEEDERPEEVQAPPAKMRRLLRRVSSEIPEDVWRRFTPKEHDANLCLARTWSLGRGEQCKRRPASGRQLCQLHLSGAAHGLVTGSIPTNKLQLDLETERKASARARSEAAHLEGGQSSGSGGAVRRPRFAWYTRYAMWWQALRLRELLVSLSELTDEEYIKCLEGVNEYYRTT